MHKTILSKRELLDLIACKRILWLYQLIELGYSYWGATAKLRRLRKERLAQPFVVKGATRGAWILTEKGYARLWYLHEAGKFRSKYVEGRLQK